MKRACFAFAAGALALAVLPAGASAAMCTFPAAPGPLTVTAAAADTQISLQRSGNAIQVFTGAASGTPEACGLAPDVTNVTTITVNGGAATNLQLLVSLQGGPFEPGDADPTEGTGVPEIEIIFAGGAGTDRLNVDGTDSADKFRFGQTAPGTLTANLNIDRETSSQDFDDVSTTSVEELVSNGRRGDDELNATGNSATGIGPADPDLLTLQGGNQVDVVRGGPGADGLQGGSQNDNLIGGAGNDALDGGDDNDKLDGGAGGDSVEGGNDSDRVSYEDRTTPVAASLGNGAADDGGAEDGAAGAKDNLGATVENITGGSGNDVLTGSALGNSMVGGLGDDLISGLGANDTLEGGVGNDTEDGGEGSDLVKGESGLDVLLGGPGGDRVFGGDLADKLFGGTGGDLLRGERGKDLFKGQGGNDRLAAKDRRRDAKIDCGAGKAKKESAKVDRSDPKPKSC